MLRMTISQKITTMFEAEQHVYSIPVAGQLSSKVWSSLTHELRHNLRSRAVLLWRDYLESEGRLTPHPPIVVPEYREMLTHPDGDLIVEEL
jgi:hypothetical protein